MSLINVGLETLGAKVIETTQRHLQELEQARHILQDDNNYWVSGQGIPQYLIISLEDVIEPYAHICSIGFSLRHDNEANPRRIKLMVGQSKNCQYIHWQTLILKKMSGQQYFKISLLPTYYRFIKIIISETFGDFQTYIDQIYVMAQPKENSYIHELEVIDIERERKILSYFGHEISDNCHKQSSLHSLIESTRSPPQGREEFNGNFSEQRQSSEDKIIIQELVAGLNRLEDTIEIVERKVDVLDLKIMVSKDNLQRKILDKVEDLIDKKIEKTRSVTLFEKPTVQPVTKHKFNRQTDKLNSRRTTEFSNDRYTKQSSKGNHLPSSTSNKQTDKNSRSQQLQKDYVTQLLLRLSEKLKEREVKIKKLRDKQVYKAKQKSRAKEPKYFL